MENELRILDTIEKNDKVTQREIATNTGMSLGNVNILIKRLVKKGLVKIERLNPRTIRYILTPHGMKEKAEATYRYIVASYKYINEIEAKIDTVLKSGIFSYSSDICLYGRPDELCSIILNRLNSTKLKYIHITSQEDMYAWLKRLENEDKVPTIVWQPDYAEYLKQKNIEYINLLDIV